jgi:hypothetical protein
MASYGYTFNSGDGVTPTRLNAARTVSDIVNADIKSDAAIAGTKIAPNFGSQNVVTTGSGAFGTATLADRLNVAGTIRVTNTSNAANFGSLRDGGGLIVESHNSNPLYFFTGGSEKARFDSSGNFGIGKSPAAKLDVDGIVNSTDSYRVNGTQVAQGRVTGWGAPTGTISRSALTLTASATYSQSEMNTVIQSLKAVITDLRTHGLIGN